MNSINYAGVYKYNINLIGTVHREHGNCNSNELCNILETINPEIIFEEIDYFLWIENYKNQSDCILEINTIKQYLEKHQVKQIPVDTYKPLKSYYNDSKYMHDIIFSNNRIIECRILRNLLDNQFLLESQHGFSYLNSKQNDELFVEISTLERSILEIIHNESLFSIYRMERDVIEKREFEIINNIYNYSKEHKYNQALLFIGAGHRKSIIDKVQDYERKNEIKLNWNFTL
jgi:hypothetical protein